MQMREGVIAMLKKLSIAAFMGTLVACGGGDNNTSNVTTNETDRQSSAEAPKANQVKLYILDCGTIEISDIGIFSSSGDFDGQSDTFVDSCFLIRHPKGDLLWDLGLPSALVGEPPQEDGIFIVSMDTTISNQLIEIGMGPEEVEFVSVSHHKFDHIGQIDQVQDATWIVHEDEYSTMFPPVEEPVGEEEAVPPSGVEAGTDAGLQNPFSGFEALERDLFSGEKDVFGDGSVIIFPTPGPTPGHTSLQVELANTGTILLTGDLYHRTESRQLERVPQFNSSEPMTLESMKDFEARAQRLNATVIIQHEPNDIDPLPKSPKFLD